MGNIPEEMVIMVGLLMGIYYCKIIDGLQLFIANGNIPEDY